MAPNHNGQVLRDGKHFASQIAIQMYLMMIQKNSAHFFPIVDTVCDVREDRLLLKTVC